MRVVCNVMHMVSGWPTYLREERPVFKLRGKYVRLLSALCGHSDREVRVLAWGTLAECVRSYTGAVQLVKGMLDDIGHWTLTLISEPQFPFSHSQNSNIYRVAFMRVPSVRPSIQTIVRWFETLPQRFLPICSVT